MILFLGEIRCTLSTFLCGMKEIGGFSRKSPECFIYNYPQYLASHGESQLGESWLTWIQLNDHVCLRVDERIMSLQMLGGFMRFTQLLIQEELPMGSIPVLLVPAVRS